MEFPVDLLALSSLQELQEPAERLLWKLLYSHPDDDERFTQPDGTVIPINSLTVSYAPVYGDVENEKKVLALFDPRDPTTAVALYLNSVWWAVEDILKTGDHERDGLREVKTLGERIVLYVLNRIIYRAQEMEGHEAPFLCHSEGDQAKILWTDGLAVGFYSVKPQGSLCRSFVTQRYQLSVMDSIFVRKSHRRRGFGLQMLQDFVQCFKDHPLGVKYPIPPSMFKVCQKYLSFNPQCKELLYEVEDIGSPFKRKLVAKKTEAMAVRELYQNTVINSEASADDSTANTLEITYEVIEVAEDTEGTPVSTRCRCGELARRRLREVTEDDMEDSAANKIIRLDVENADVLAEMQMLQEHEYGDIVPVTKEQNIVTRDKEETFTYSERLGTVSAHRLVHTPHTPAQVENPNKFCIIEETSIEDTVKVTTHLELSDELEGENAEEFVVGPDGNESPPPDTVMTEEDTDVYSKGETCSSCSAADAGAIPFVSLESTIKASAICIEQGTEKSTDEEDDQTILRGKTEIAKETPKQKYKRNINTEESEDRVKEKTDGDIEKEEAINTRAVEKTAALDKATDTIDERITVDKVFDGKKENDENTLSRENETGEQNVDKAEDVAKQDDATNTKMGNVQEDEIIHSGVDLVANKTNADVITEQIIINVSETMDNGQQVLEATKDVHVVEHFEESEAWGVGNNKDQDYETGIIFTEQEGNVGEHSRKVVIIVNESTDEIKDLSIDVEVQAEERDLDISLLSNQPVEQVESGPVDQANQAVAEIMEDINRVEDNKTRDIQRSVEMAGEHEIVLNQEKNVEATQDDAIEDQIICDDKMKELRPQSETLSGPHVQEHIEAAEIQAAITEQMVEDDRIKATHVDEEQELTATRVLRGKVKVIKETPKHKSQQLKKGQIEKNPLTATGEHMKRKSDAKVAEENVENKAAAEKHCARRGKATERKGDKISTNEAAEEEMVAVQLHKAVSDKTVAEESIVKPKENAEKFEEGETLHCTSIDSDTTELGRTVEKEVESAEETMQGNKEKEAAVEMESATVESTVNVEEQCFKEGDVERTAEDIKKDMSGVTEEDKEEPTKDKEILAERNKEPEKAEAVRTKISTQADMGSVCGGAKIISGVESVGEKNTDNMEGECRENELENQKQAAEAETLKMSINDQELEELQNMTASVKTPLRRTSERHVITDNDQTEMDMEAEGSGEYVEKTQGSNITEELEDVSGGNTKQKSSEKGSQHEATTSYDEDDESARVLRNRVIKNVYQKSTRLSGRLTARLPQDYQQHLTEEPAVSASANAEGTMVETNAEIVVEEEVSKDEQKKTDTETTPQICEERSDNVEREAVHEAEIIMEMEKSDHPTDRGVQGEDASGENNATEIPRRVLKGGTKIITETPKRGVKKHKVIQPVEVDIGQASGNDKERVKENLEAKEKSEGIEEVAHDETGVNINAGEAQGVEVNKEGRGVASERHETVSEKQDDEANSSNIAEGRVLRSGATTPATARTTRTSTRVRLLIDYKEQEESEEHETDQEELVRVQETPEKGRAHDNIMETEKNGNKDENLSCKEALGAEKDGIQLQHVEQGGGEDIVGKHSLTEKDGMIEEDFKTWEESATVQTTPEATSRPQRKRPRDNDRASDDGGAEQEEASDVHTDEEHTGGTPKKSRSVILRRAVLNRKCKTPRGKSQQL